MAEEARRTTGAGPAADADEEPSSEGSEPTREAREEESSGDAQGEESSGDTKDEESSGNSQDQESSGDAQGERASGDKGSNGSGGSDGGETEKGGLPAAPSLGPDTKIEREPVEERLARHDQSTEDAMGLDKRRQVIGQGYGPSKKRQLTLYGLALAVAAAIFIGLFLLVSALDTPVGKDIPQSAPWAQPNAKQHAPRPLQ